MSSALRPRGIAVAGTVCRGASSEISGAATTSSGTSISTPALLRLRPGGPHVVEAVALDEALPHLAAVGRDQRERHRAADQQRVDPIDQRVDHRELVGDLRAAEDRDVRARGIVEQPPEHLDLPLEQPPGDRGATAREHQLGQRRDARVRAVRRAEGVVHVGVGELGEAPREGGVVRLLARVEPQVLEHHDGIAGQRLGHRVREPGHGPAEELLEPLGGPTGREAGVDLPLRPPEVRGEHERRAAVEQLA